MRNDLHYGECGIVKPRIQTFTSWNYEHRLPGPAQQPASPRRGANVMPDLANAMKLNSNLKDPLSAGYFDLATPFYQDVHETNHLRNAASLQANTEYRFYESGHIIYAKDSALKMLHDNVAAFIRRASNLGH